MARMTKRQFLDAAKPFILKTQDGQPIVGKPTIFGQQNELSAGWNITGKLMAEVNGEMLEVQVTGNLSVIHSKTWEKGDLPDKEPKAAASSKRKKGEAA